MPRNGKALMSTSFAGCSTPSFNRSTRFVPPPMKRVASVPPSRTASEISAARR
jgi:hypothetical protein